MSRYAGSVNPFLEAPWSISNRLNWETALMMKYQWLSIQKLLIGRLLVTLKKYGGFLNLLCAYEKEYSNTLSLSPTCQIQRKRQRLIWWKERKMEVHPSDCPSSFHPSVQFNTLVLYILYLFSTLTVYDRKWLCTRRRNMIWNQPSTFLDRVWFSAKIACSCAYSRIYTSKNVFA